MAGIGATLREARERAHLEIVDFESRTKIRAKYLRALEDEEWSLLPGYTFTKGFLRTYADMLGLDGRALVDEFKRQYRDPSELEAPPLSPAGRRDPRRTRERPREQGGERSSRSRTPSRPPIAVAVAVLVILLAGALYAVGVLLPRGHGHNTTTSTTTSTTTHSTTHHHRTGGSGTTTRQPTVVGVKLLPRSSVYVCMIGYPGTSQAHPHIRINARTLTPGGYQATYHDNHFYVTFGNNSIVLLIDGHRHTLAASANGISVRITLHGRVLPLTQAQVPHCA